jgi:hypothetical protein
MMPERGLTKLYDHKYKTPIGFMYTKKRGLYFAIVNIIMIIIIIIMKGRRPLTI